MDHSETPTINNEISTQVTHSNEQSNLINKLRTIDLSGKNIDGKLQSNEGEANSIKPYTFSSPRPQNIQLPSFITKHIYNNTLSSPSIYQKLTLTCKQFFSTHRLVCVDTVFLTYKSFAHFKESNKNRKSVSLWSQEKLWITGSLTIGYLYVNIFNRIHKSTVTFMTLGDKIRYADFVKIAKNLKVLEMKHGNIINDENVRLALGDIASSLPNLCELTIRSNLNFVSISDLASPYFPKLEKIVILQLYPVDGIVNTDDLYEFIKIHPKITVEISLRDTDIWESLQQAFYQSFPQATPQNSMEEEDMLTWSFDNTLIKIMYHE